jgi:hypothetical protein
MWGDARRTHHGIFPHLNTNTLSASSHPLSSHGASIRDLSRDIGHEIGPYAASDEVAMFGLAVEPAMTKLAQIRAP